MFHIWNLQPFFRKKLLTVQIQWMQHSVDALDDVGSKCITNKSQFISVLQHFFTTISSHNCVVFFHSLGRIHRPPSHGGFNSKLNVSLLLLRCHTHRLNH